MSGRIPDAVFGVGVSGYALLHRGDSVPQSAIDRFLRLCKTITWSSRKHDFPDVICVVAFPWEDRLWTCRISESERDEFNRGLGVKVEGYLTDPVTLHASIDPWLVTIGLSPGSQPSGVFQDDVQIWGDRSLLNISNQSHQAGYPIHPIPEKADVGTVKRDSAPTSFEKRNIMSNHRTRSWSGVVLWCLLVISVLGLVASTVSAYRKTQELDVLTSQLNDIESAIRETLLVSSPHAQVHGSGIREAYLSLQNRARELEGWRTEMLREFPGATTPEEIIHSVRSLKRDLKAEQELRNSQDQSPDEKDEKIEMLTKENNRRQSIFEQIQSLIKTEVAPTK